MDFSSGITLEVLAEWAATSKPRVSQVLEELQQAGALRLSGGEIDILLPSTLEDWAKQLRDQPTRWLILAVWSFLGTTLVQKIYINNLEATQQRPLYWRSRLALANAALALGRHEDAICLYR